MVIGETRNSMTDRTSNSIVNKIIVAGGREFTDYDKAKRHILELIDEGFITWDDELVCGMARGADRVGMDVWIHVLRNKVHEFPADWNKHGRAAGPIRNAEMGQFADKLIAFWNGESKGTKHMIDYMEKLGKPVKVILY